MCVDNDNNRQQGEAFKLNNTNLLNRNLIDPVCGMKVNPKSTPFKVTLDGRRYYFCAEGCRLAFEKDPCKYLSGSPPRRKGWWGRYLDRLNKATEGKSLQCH